MDMKCSANGRDRKGEQHYNGSKKKHGAVNTGGSCKLGDENSGYIEVGGID